MAPLGYLHNFRIFRVYVCCIRKTYFIDGCFIVVDTNVQPFCVGMFTGGTMAQLRASDVGRGTGRGRGQGRGHSIGPPRSRVCFPLEDIDSYVNHSWWITAIRDIDTTPFYGVLHILVDPIRGETIYSGLGDEYGKILHIASPRHDGDGSFYIRSTIGALDRTYRYKLHRDHMMQPIPLALMQLRPALAGLRTAQGWWLGYDEETQRRRVQVTCICGNLSSQEQK